MSLTKEERAKLREFAASVVAVGIGDSYSDLMATDHGDAEATRTQVFRLCCEVVALELELKKQTGVVHDKIESGNDLDWAAVREAGAAIAKQCEDIAWAAPFDTSAHALRAGYVCDAIQKITVALKLRPAIADELPKLVKEIAAFVEAEAGGLEESGQSTSGAELAERIRRLEFRK